MVIVGRGTPDDRASLSIMTRKGYLIPNERRMERAPEALKAAVDSWAKARPNAILRSITNVYNCMGMAFASRRTWIDNGQITKIFSDDGYERVGNWKDVKVGDVAVYSYDGAVSHVGMVAGIELNSGLKSNMIIMSKWGGDGEYFHEPHDVPEIYGTLVEYWTDRKSVS